MAAQSKLQSAWRALAGTSNAGEWKTIPIEKADSIVIHACRTYPKDAESLLIGFKTISLPRKEILPQGNGFLVDVVENSFDQSRSWISLEKTTIGNLEFFTYMCDDILTFFLGQPIQSEKQCLQALLARVRAWQSFMNQSQYDVLSFEAEIGLFGELIVLKNIIEIGLPHSEIVDSWRGPLDGLHDFFINAGALEVKTTLSENSFIAKIGSIDQLDDDVASPLFLAGVRLKKADDGLTLPQLADSIRKNLMADQVVLNNFENLLIRSGLFETFTDKYVRKFLHSDTKIFLVHETFPKLIRSNVNSAIKRLTYEIDLNQITDKSIDLNYVVSQMRGE